MKHTFIYALLISFLFTACVQDFLSLEPISDLTEGNFFKTGADAEAALVAAYDVLQSEYYIFDLFTNGDVISDNCYAGGDNPNNFQLDEFTITATNANAERDWRYLYEGISRANAVLDNVGAIESPDLIAERKQQILGEAAFLRAVHYFQLVNLYGEVPLVLKKVNSTDPEVINQARSAVPNVYNTIIADLQFAIENAPISTDQPQRVSRSAAQAMLAKVYAHQPSPDWNMVSLYAATVIDDGPHSLLPNYDHLWDGQHENSAESIFEIQYIGGTNEANWGPQLWLPPSLTGDSWRKFNTPSNDLIEAFTAAGDEVRMKSAIIFQNNLPWQDANFPDGNIPFPYKQRLANGWSSPNNIILLRLADIILLKAEAKAELNELAEAKALLNQVRNRVGLPATNAVAQAEVLDAIALERRLELAFEGHRWYDLKRRGKALEVMEALGKGYPLDETKLFFPIPQAELDRNPNLTQNAGY
ncbi:MAG: RagB/SusD family nutrient uptake outer membrane protein [Bacteroidia bacterium]